MKLESMHGRPGRVMLVVAVVAGAVCALSTAGPLNPPSGPVASSNKTLSEIEPRIAVNAVNTPGDSTSVLKITAAGSYYLAADPGAVLSGKHGILIAASYVTLDLNGFEIWSVGNIFNALDGVNAASGTSHIVVRNGITRNMNGDGVDLSLATDCAVENVQSFNNNGGGIRVGDRCAVRGCRVSGNVGDGILAGEAAVVTECTAASGGAIGITVGSGVVRDCVAHANAGAGISSGGGTIINCVATQNSNGIASASGCVIEGCAARSNSGNGIYALGNCAILNNVCSAGSSSALACILVGGTGSRIEGNDCTGAAKGISVESIGNIIIRNTCRGNTTDWVIVANNVYGPIIDRRTPASGAVSGFSATSTLGSVDPNANFSY